jgi:hypothetical protein
MRKPLATKNVVTPSEPPGGQSWMSGMVRDDGEYRERAHTVECWLIAEASCRRYLARNSLRAAPLAGDACHSTTHLPSPRGWVLACVSAYPLTPLYTRLLPALTEPQQPALERRPTDRQVRRASERRSCRTIPRAICRALVAPKTSPRRARWYSRNSRRRQRVARRTRKMR